MHNSKIIKRKAEEFLREHAIQGYVTHSYREALSDLDDYLQEIRSDYDQNYFLTEIKKSLTNGYNKHVEKCEEPHCQIEEINEDFIYSLENRINEISRQEDQIQLADLKTYNNYLDKLNNRIESLEIELEEYQKEAIDEIVSLRMDLELLTKKQAERQMLGAWFKIATFLTKAGLEQDEIKSILTKDWKSVQEALSNSFDIAKVLIG